MAFGKATPKGANLQTQLSETFSTLTGNAELFSAAAESYRAQAETSAQASAVAANQAAAVSKALNILVEANVTI